MFFGGQFVGFSSFRLQPSPSPLSRAEGLYRSLVKVWSVSGMMPELVAISLSVHFLLVFLNQSLITYTLTGTRTEQDQVGTAMSLRASVLRKGSRKYAETSVMDGERSTPYLHSLSLA